MFSHRPVMSSTQIERKFFAVTTRNTANFATLRSGERVAVPLLSMSARTAKQITAKMLRFVTTTEH